MERDFFTERTYFGADLPHVGSVCGNEKQRVSYNHRADGRQSIDKNVVVGCLLPLNAYICV